MSQYSLTEEQKSLMKYFQGLDKQVVYESVPEIYLLQSKESQSQIQPELCYQIQPLILEIDYTQNDNTNKARKKLGAYKQKSKAVQQIGNLICDYDKNFKNMLEQKDFLVNLLQQLNQQTSELVQKQKKYIDLSIAIKQALDYYLYIDKFQWNWTCQPSYREMFEDQLQPTLSQLTDAVQFFTTNTNYANAKKYINLSLSYKTKVSSFTKSFYIKLLNKQYSYSLKNSRTHIWQHISNYYPKSKPKFLNQYLSLFPQFRKNLRSVLQIAKQNANDTQINALETRELEIQQFQLHQSSLSLIGYLEKNLPQIYDEVILKFISFYRINLHQTIYKSISIDPSIKFEQTFRQCFIQSAYIIASQAAYLGYCFKSTNEVNKEYGRTTISKIAEFYKVFLSRIAKDPSKNKNPIGLCIQLNHIIEETQKFFGNYLSGHYQTYVFGGVCEFLEVLGVKFVKGLILSIAQRIQSDLQAVCHNFLPKFRLENNKEKITEQIRQLISIIPTLKYCPKQSQQYLVGSLDIIIKSIKQCNNKIDSRIQCYVWNLEIFAAIQDVINKNSFSLLKKQMRLQISETASVFQKIRSLNPGESLANYVNELFATIKTGVPALNELTLDFNKFINQYHSDLKQKFVKDMVYIHAKNIIQFLQKLKQCEENNKQIQEICQFGNLKKLYNSYLLSIQNFVKQSKQILVARKDYSLYSEGEESLLKLIKQVEEMIIDLMSSFYIEGSKWNPETQKFQSITSIRKNIQQMWSKQNQ